MSVRGLPVGLRVSRGAAWFAALLGFTTSAARADVLVAPPGQNFSANFPSEPDQKLFEKEGLTMITYSARDPDKILMLASATWPTDPDVADESQSILASMVQRFQGEILSVEKRDLITAAGKKVPEKHFTFGNEKLWGEGIVIFSGRHSYVVSVAKLGKSEGLDEAGKKFLSSFKILD